MAVSHARLPIVQPGWYYLVNLVLHVANSVLVYGVFHHMTRCVWRPAFVAALSAVHPLYIESVAWIAEHKDVRSMLFWLLSIICYVYTTRHASWSAYILAILCMSAGLASKPMLVTAPFLFVLLDHLPLGWMLPLNRSAQ